LSQPFFCSWSILGDIWIRRLKWVIVYIKAKEKILSVNAIQGTKELGLDVNKLIRTRSAQNSAGVSLTAEDMIRIQYL